MLEIILAGGWLMAPILLCSTLAVAIVIERFWTLRKSKVTPDGLAGMVEDWATRHELDERHLEQLRVESPLGRVYAAALRNRKRSRELIKEAVEDSGRHVVHDLERFLNTLGTIAGISPLLGLFKSTNSRGKNITTPKCRQGIPLGNNKTAIPHIAIATV